mgnify:CR=1 FL=1
MKKTQYHVPDHIRAAYPDFIFHRSTDYLEETEIITVMHCKGHAMAQVYWYHDQPKRVFLTHLVVEFPFRNRGLGLQLQQLREDIGRDRGAKWALLWVVKRSWMSKWYKRRGYRWHCKFDEEPKCMWMKKKL